METPEYTKLLTRVDAQLEAAQRAWEEQGRKVQLEQRLKLIDHQAAELLKREEAFSRFGASAPPDLRQAIDRLGIERAQVLEELKPKPALAPVLTQGVSLLPPAESAELSALLDELLETELTHLGAEERWTQFEIWALRWRIVAQKVGNAAVDMSPLAKMVYRIVREKMEASTFCWYIDCLNPDRQMDWGARLAHCQGMLTRQAIQRTQKPEEPVDLPGQALDELYAYLQSPSPEGKSEEEWLRTLKHLVRQAARFPHTREEVGEKVAEYRSALEPEFAFLWKKNESHEELKEKSTARLSNRKIVEKLLRRFRAKGLIGGSHGPYDPVVCRGFAGHDFDRSKAAMDLLVKGEVVRSKSTSYGIRLSLEPKSVGRVDAFLGGKPLGLAPVDEWIG